MDNFVYWQDGVPVIDTFTIARVYSCSHDTVVQLVILLESHRHDVPSDDEQAFRLWPVYFKDEDGISTPGYLMSEAFFYYLPYEYSSDAINNRRRIKEAFCSLWDEFLDCSDKVAETIH